MPHQVTLKQRRMYLNLILFTYCVTQELNLEIAVDLGKRFSLPALRRFLAKRGQSKLDICNNFKTFKYKRAKEFLPCNSN